MKNKYIQNTDRQTDQMNTSYIYVKTDKILYKGKDVFYKKTINTELHQATEFSQYYEYYYKKTQNENDKPIPLGRFITLRKYRSDSYFDDCDYPIIVFDKDFVFESKKECIYCKGIPDSDTNMVLIDDMDFEGFPVYYQK